MKKIILKLLRTALNLFKENIVDLVTNLIYKNILTLAIARVQLINNALLDSNPNDEAQVNELLRTTIVSEEFLNLDKSLSELVSSKLKDKSLVELVNATSKLRFDFYAIIGDDNFDNEAQLKKYLEEVIISPEFEVIYSLVIKHYMNKKRNVNRIAKSK